MKYAASIAQNVVKNVRIKLLAAACCLAASFIAQTASAGIILVVGDRIAARTEVVTRLNALGHTATDGGTEASGSLAGFDTVWQTATHAAITATEQTNLVDFLNGGGGVFVTGERPCCEPRNDSVTALVQAVVTGSGGMNFGDAGDISGPYTANTGAGGNIDDTPNPLTGISLDFPGGISGIGGDDVWVTGSGGIAVGAVFDETDMIAGAGRLAILMDSDWLLPGFDDARRPALIENIEVFLEGGIIRVPEPGTLALFGLGLAGLGIVRRRRAAP